MKTLFLFTLTLILAINLNARENPFAMTDIFEEETGKIVDSNENLTTPEAVQEAQYIQEVQKNISNVNKNMVEEGNKKITPAINDKTMPKSYSKQEVDSLLQKTKSQTEQKTKEIIKKELATTKSSEPEQVIYVKPRTDVVEDDALLSKKLLPFLNVEFNDNKLIIKTTDKVSKKFSVDKENKLIIDYKAKVEFNTKKDDLESKNFKRVTLGNHKSEGYYRVAIELLNKPSAYKVAYENEVITITSLK